ncbi:MAG: TIGR03960 family B12-binding radical SAM protein [Lyngbya sp.]|nr:TIGR03960 family B12-binding radical SAM protein [Lyngbya sp.]
MAVAVEKLITPDIHQPARYLGNELGAKHKPWDSAQVRWALTYPEIYEVGASNLGHIILYNILNTQPRQLCDRAYLPAPDLAAKLRQTQTPLFAVESRRELKAFDILGFSLSYELGATNILEMLDLAKIPLTWKERQNPDGNTPLGEYPLIFAGGQTATSNPEPYADFFDFIALGDGEELLPEIGLILEEGKANGLSREDLLLDLAQVPGVYVPQFYEMAADGSVHPHRPDVPKRILRRVATPLPAYSIRMVPLVETVHDRLTMEIRRGCTRGCRFCQPGMLTRPARDVEPEAIIDAIEKGMKATGYNEFSLLSLSCSDYLALPALGVEIKNRLKDQNVSLSLPSQRVDRFDENIANIVGGMRSSSLTFAPEAGTQRMRDIVNKGLTNEELLRGVKTAYEQGWDKLKLYFMIGLPGETDADVLGIAETVRWLLRECSAPKRRRLNINLTISNFTPKPHTPFQWHSVSTAEFQRKQELLKAEFRRLKGVKANFTDVRISAMEDFVGRGDRRLAPVVRRAWELGAGMDAWWESQERAFAAWTQAIAEAGLSWKYRQIENGEWNVMELTDSEMTETQALLDQPLPWDHLDTGIDKNWLKEDLQRALEAATVPDCSFEGCSHCGVCGIDLGHNIVIEPPPIPQFSGHCVPDSQRVERMRVIMGKQGNMALVGHLDWMKFLDRMTRRAGLPISFTGGYHPSPRIYPANALPLGATSSGEIIEFDLTESMEIEKFRDILISHLPADLPIYQVERLDVKSKTASQFLEKAEYLLTIGSSQGVEKQQWLGWIAAIVDTQEIIYEKTTKSGKTRYINLREQLFELEVVDSSVGRQTGMPETQPTETVTLGYVGGCRNDGTQLRPEQVLYMLEQVSQQEFQLLHLHRSRLIVVE